MCAGIDVEKNHISWQLLSVALQLQSYYCHIVWQ